MRMMFPNRALSSRRHFRSKFGNFRVHRFSSRLAATGNHNRTNWRRKEEYLYRQKVLCEDGKEVGVSKAQIPSQVPAMLRRTIRHGSAGSAFLTETQKGGGKKLLGTNGSTYFFLKNLPLYVHLSSVWRHLNKNRGRGEKDLHLRKFRT